MNNKKLDVSKTRDSRSSLIDIKLVKAISLRST